MSERGSNEQNIRYVIPYGMDPRYAMPMVGYGQLYDPRFMPAYAPPYDPRFASIYGQQYDPRYFAQPVPSAEQPSATPPTPGQPQAVSQPMTDPSAQIPGSPFVSAQTNQTAPSPEIPPVTGQVSSEQIATQSAQVQPSQTQTAAEQSVQCSAPQTASDQEPQTVPYAAAPETISAETPSSADQTVQQPQAQPATIDNNARVPQDAAPQSGIPAQTVQPYRYSVPGGYIPMYDPRLMNSFRGYGIKQDMRYGSLSRNGNIHYGNEEGIELNDGNEVLISVNLEKNKKNKNIGNVINHFSEKDDE